MPTVKILMPSLDASSAASSGSLSVSSPSVSSRITCAARVLAAVSFARSADQLVQRRRVSARPDRGATHRHVPRVEIAPEQLHRRVVGGRRVGQRLARERHHADAIAGQPIEQPLQLALGAFQARRVDVLAPASTCEKSSATTRSRPRCRASSARPARLRTRQRQRQQRERDHHEAGRTTLRAHRHRRGHRSRSAPRRPAAPAAGAARERQP